MPGSNHFPRLDLDNQNLTEAYRLLPRPASVTVGGKERGVNEKPKVFVNSGGFIIQSWFGVIRLFRWVVIIVTNGKDERNRARQRFGLGERVRFWFGYYGRFRN
jgi:predicted membrane metal-binding protein